MNTISSKRMIRFEKKKKKMAAFLNITKLNEEDRLKSTSLVEPVAKRLRTDIKNCSSEDLSTESNKNSEDTTEVTYSDKPKLFSEDFKTMLGEKHKVKLQPKFKLREIGKAASLEAKMHERIPLFLCDIQHLLMHSQLGQNSPYSPSRWCCLDKFNRLKHTNVLVVENVSMYHYQSYESLFKFLKEKFSVKLEIITPVVYKSEIVQDLIMVPLTATKICRFVSEYGMLDNTIERCLEMYDSLQDLFPLKKVKGSSTLEEILPKGDKFSRTHLLLSGWQMIEENFPMPIQGLMETKYTGYVLSKDSYKNVTSLSPMFGIDCEMCLTTTTDLELTRISIVDENYHVFYEELVKPDNKITDYLTQFSGITQQLMSKVTKKLKDVQEDLRRLLPSDAILVGQSLSNDLHALKMMHPYVIDTSVIYNISGDRTRKSKLQVLAQEFLNERIQQGRTGHCSVEDSLAALKLTKLKLARHIYFGDAVTKTMASQTKQHPELRHPYFTTSLLKQTTRFDKTALVVSDADISEKYQCYTFKDQPSTDQRNIQFITATKNHKIMKKFCKKINDTSLNIAHIIVTDSQLENDTSQVCRDINKWTEDIYNITEEPALCIIILGGQKSGNGCCFIALKEI